MRRAEKHKAAKAKEREASKVMRAAALRDFSSDRADARNRETRRRNSIRLAAEEEARRRAQEEARALAEAQKLLLAVQTQSLSLENVAAAGK